MYGRVLIPMILIALCIRAQAQDSIPIPVKAVCKGYYLTWYSHPDKEPVPRQRRPGAPDPDKKIPFLQMHGNILYDLNYRSNIDTPYAERNVYQHMIQTYMDVTVKGNYPFRIYFTTRFSNSPFFRNYSDVSVLYNANDFSNKVKRQVHGLLMQQVGLDSLERMARQLNDKEKKYHYERHLMDSAAWLQRIIAAREEAWLKEQARLRPQPAATGPTTPKMPDISQYENYKYDQRMLRSLLPHGKKDSSKGPDLDTAGLRHQYDSLKHRLDSLRDDIDSLQKRYHKLKEWQEDSTARLKKELDQITSGSELKEKLKSLHLSDSSLPKGYQTLYSVRSFGIGRTFLNYSELSARNVSINGIQLEYNPSTYMAVAAGTVDYRFRDYNVQSPAKGQYIALVRYGWGKKEGNNVILTYYTGRRQLYNSYTTVQGGTIPNYNLMGFTVEGHYRINRNSSFTAEVAKSSSPYYSLDSTRPHVLASALKISDRTNEAFAVKFNTFLPATQTQFDATYRKYGANFQSFSLFSTGTEQSSWSVRAGQPFLRKRLMVTASIRTNDFTNPLLSTTYKSSTVFKSIQATWRQKGWPTLSAGYFPSSQLTKISNDQYQENLFYTFTASAVHNYRMKQVSFIGMLMYTQFYNRGSDSNFVYYNTKNLLFSQSAFVGRWTFQTQLSDAMSTNYTLYTIDNKVDVRITRWLSAGAGVKYNKQTVYNIDQWGYSADAVIRVPVGEFRLMADKGFIPGSNRQLVPNNYGRLTYSKVF
jgi:hypothetical protein